MTTAPSCATWDALGTTAEVRVARAGRLRAARSIVDRHLRAIDLACSRFRADSELERLNAAAGHWVGVGPLLLEAVTVAVRVAAQTGGAVDPTVGEALILAGYDRDFAAVSPVDRSLQAVRVPGWRTIAVDAAARRVRIAAGVRLDLGATAKALVADRAAAAAAHATGTGVLVNLGGDIAMGGAAPQDGWPVRVADSHRPAPDAPGQTLAVRSGALATSSTTVRRWGPAAHHIIDPATGRPAAECWRTVSVAAASCVDANAASTAAVVLGAAAPAWLEQRRLPARLVARDGRVVTVAGWPRDGGA